MTLLVPGTSRPTNLHYGEGVQATIVDSDLYGMCDRIREISPDLFIIALSQDDEYAFVIMERCADGVDRLVIKVKELDGRVEHKLRQLLAQPLDSRMDQLEREEYELNEKVHDDEMDELYERMGRPMWAQLEHDGFIQRPVSYPKTGVVAPGKAR